jgi:uncharacterized protein
MAAFSQDPSPVLNRQSVFSFECGRCSQCCTNKKIQINPYEVARLAANLKVSTTEFLLSFTTDGVYLAATSNGKCVFLEENGCSVHPDRPLVCRLYPLGRLLTSGGEESFVLSTLHPQCRGTWSKTQTIEEYMTGQGVHEFLNAGGIYRSLLKTLVEALGKEKDFPIPKWSSVKAGADLQVSFPHLLDPDWVLKNMMEPKKVISDPWHKMISHVGAIENWLMNLNIKKEGIYGI